MPLSCWRREDIEYPVHMFCEVFSRMTLSIALWKILSAFFNPVELGTCRQWSSGSRCHPLLQPQQMLPWMAMVSTTAEGDLSWCPICVGGTLSTMTVIGTMPAPPLSYAVDWRNLEVYALTWAKAGCHHLVWLASFCVCFCPLKTDRP